jgi:Cu2+-exporting ATPase
VAEQVEVMPGSGISGNIDGHAIRLGHVAFALADSAQSHHSDDLWLADKQGPIAALRLREATRDDASRTLEALRERGVATVIASGDAMARVDHAAAALGVGEHYARQTPTDKLALLERKRHDGHITLAVGDGNNDAPILAGADVSAALASGTELAQAHADLLLLGGRLHGLVEARDIACTVRDVIARGRRWSLAYNLCAVPFAALGWVPPWLAAIGMSVSSLVVVLNAWRIGRDGPPAPTVRA